MRKLDQDELGWLAINTVVRTLYAKLKGSFNSTNFEMDAKGCDVYMLSDEKKPVLIQVYKGCSNIFRYILYIWTTKYISHSSSNFERNRRVCYMGNIGQILLQTE